MKRILIAALFLGLGACNTIDGVGQDISSGARTVQNAL
jgi:predicted small secreted protein